LLPATVTGYRLPLLFVIAAVARAARRLTLAAARAAAASRAAFGAVFATRRACQCQRGNRKERRCNQGNNFGFHRNNPLSVKRTAMRKRAGKSRDTLRALNSKIVFETEHRCGMPQAGRQLPQGLRGRAMSNGHAGWRNSNRFPRFGLNSLRFGLLRHQLRAALRGAAFAVARARAAGHVSPLAVHGRGDRRVRERQRRDPHHRKR
jgi:hypothetical protein